MGSVLCKRSNKAVANKLERVGLSHPEVCQANKGNGPCEYRAVPNGTTCLLHGGSIKQACEERKELRNYQLQGIYARRAAELSNSANIKNLSDEIGLMRVALETVFNDIKTPNEMLLYTDKIEKLATSISKLTGDWQKLEERNKELLSRETVFAIVDAFLNKVIEHVADADVIEKLAGEFHGIISARLGLTGTCEALPS